MGVKREFLNRAELLGCFAVRGPPDKRPALTALKHCS